MSQLDVEQKVENKKMNSCRAACLVYKMCSKSRFQHSCINRITELVFHMKKNVFIQSSEFNLYFVQNQICNFILFHVSLQLDLVNLR